MFELLQGRDVVLIGCSATTPSPELGLRLRSATTPSPELVEGEILKVGCMIKGFSGSKSVLVSDEWGNSFKVLVPETEQMFDLEVRAWKV